MPRFVVLAHDWPAPHLDLLIERDGVLKAWRLPPDFDGITPCPAEANADHRVQYLDYEGPISGDRGVVERWDAGVAEWEVTLPERIAVRLDGQRLRGQYEIVRRDGSGWELRLCP